MQQSTVLSKSITWVLSLVLSALLVACGGGGGGGTPANLKVTVDDTRILTVDDVLKVEYLGASADDFKNKVAIRVNNTNITPLMTFNGKTATVKLYAVQSLLNIASGNTLTNPHDLNWNSVSVRMDGSQEGTGAFAFSNTPELVIKIDSLTGQTGTAGASVHIDSLPDGVSCPGDETAGYDCTVSGTVDYPQNLDSLTVEGIARRALLTAIEQTQGTGTANKALDGKGFNIVDLYFVEQSGNQADFAYKVNGVDKAFNLAIAGKTIVNAFAAQIHNIGESHIISQWINDAVKSYLATISDSAPVTLMMQSSDTDPASGDLCDVVTRLKDGSGNLPSGAGISCRLQLTSIDTTSLNNDGKSLAIDTTLSFSQCGSNGFPCDTDLLAGAWQVQAKIASNQTINGTAQLQVFDNNGTPDDTSDDTLLGHENHSIKISSAGGSGCAANGKPFVQLAFNMGSTASQLHVFQIDSPSYDEGAGEWTHSTQSATINQCLEGFALDSALPCQAESSGWSCATSGVSPVPTSTIKAAIDSSLEDSINSYVYRIARLYSINPSTALDAALICDSGTDKYTGACDDLAKANSADPWPWSVVGKEQHTPIVNSDKTAVVSAVDSQVTDMRFNTPSNAGFLSVSNRQKIQDAGIYQTALGTHFAKDAATSKVINADLANNSDVSMALSSNWLNQMLLSAFQSGKMTVTETRTIADLGADAVDLLSGLNSAFDSPSDRIDATTAMTLSMDLSNAPYVQYVNGYLELVAHNVSISFELNRTLNKDAPMFEGQLKLSDFISFPIAPSPSSASNHLWFKINQADIKARIKPLDNGKLLNLEPGDMMLSIIDADGAVIKLSPNAKNKLGLASFVTSNPDALALVAKLLSMDQGDGTIFDPKNSPTDMAAVVAGTIQQQLQQLLDQQSFIKTEFTLGEPTGTGLPATLRSLFENFFCENTGGTLVAKSRALELVADNIAFDATINNHGSNEAANMIIAASLIEKPNPSNSNAVLDLDLHYEGCASP